MNGESRRKSLKKFSKKSQEMDQVLICTDRAARGVDFEGEKVRPENTTYNITSFALNP